MTEQLDTRGWKKGDTYYYLGKTRTIRSFKPSGASKFAVLAFFTDGTNCNLFSKPSSIS